MTFRSTLVNHFIACLFFASGASLSAQNEQKGMVALEANYEEFTSKVYLEGHELETYIAYNGDSLEHHSEFARIPFNAPCINCVELLHKRTEFGRYFLDVNDPSKFYSQQSVEPLHYWKNNEWVTIDHRLKLDGEWYSSDYPHNRIRISPSEKAVLLDTPSEEVRFNQWELFGKGEDSTFYRLDYADWSNHTAGDDGIYIYNIFKGIDAELRIRRGGIKLNFIIQSIEYPLAEEYLFLDTFTAPNGPLLLSSSEDPSLDVVLGELTLMRSGEPIAFIGEAVAYPENPAKDEMQSLPYDVTGSSLSIVIEADLLETVNQGRALIIDPTVTGANTLAQAAITGSQFNATCDFATSCNHTLTVPAPANATFTDVLTTFDYIAQGACWLEDGATRFTTGGCVSPNQAGFYWFCPLVGGGDCTAENLSLWEDLASCMPNPSCEEQDIQFTLQFFRSCWGTAGCNNTCIGAGSPWTVTIVGQTVEHSSVSGGIQLSSNTACAGEEITATATGQNGVPGYTYEWSLNPGGQPVIANGQTVDLSFDNTGAQNVYSIITDACGNESITSAIVTITEGPTAEINGESSYCEGEAVTLTTGVFSSYQWSTGENTQSIQATASDSPVTVSVTDASGCAATSEPFLITEVAAPVAEASPLEQTLCDNSQAIIELSSNTPNTTFTWTVTSTGVDGAEAGSGSEISDLLTLTGEAVGQVIYLVTPSADGCEGTPIEVIVNIDTTIIPIITGDSEHCEGESVVLTTGNYVSYDWSNGGTTASVEVTAADSPVTVTAVDENGCSGTSDPFVIEQLPLPVVTAEVSANVICSGDAVDIEFNATSPGASFEYTSLPSGVSGASSGTGTTINDVLEATSDEPGTVIYTITPTADGCAGELLDVIITVDPIPNPIISGNDTYCDGEPAVLTTGNFASYEWSTGSTSQTTEAVEADNPITVSVTTENGCSGSSDPFEVSESENVTFSETISICSGESALIHGEEQNAPGVYEASFDAGGCDSTATITLEVFPLPEIQVTANPPVACSGETITLTATGAESYSWSTGEATASIEVALDETTTFTVEATSSEGCISTDEITIEVGDPDASFAFNTNEFCITNSNPVPSITGTTGGVFTISGNGVIDPASGQVDLLSSGVGSFEVTYTIPPPCDASLTLTIEIIDGGVGETVSGGSFCPNEGIVFLSVNGDEGEWSGTGIVDEFTGAFDPSIAGPGFFEISFTSTVGCITNTVEVTVEDEIIPAFVFEPEGACVPATIEFSVLNPSTEYVSAQWLIPGGSLATSPQAEITFQQPGLFDVTLELVSTSGCVFTTTQENALNITAQPTASFTASPQPTDLYNTTIEFFDQSGNGIVQWDWQFDPFNALGTSSEQDPVFTFPPGQPGEYPVTLQVIDENGCVGEVTRIVLIRDDFNIFVPNAFTPDNDGVNDVFFIRATDLDPDRFSLQIFNRWGEVVFETDDPEQVWDGSVRGGTHYVQNDVYVWRIVAFRETGFERLELTGSVTVIR